ncbi:flavin reductase [Fidelibacter multiformis]|jgi:flavin reductase (DIM6/NTAB) family NADH-FMN oxidoreductase RutF|uniref:flavin reductase n=1 Tax=Fidelibacter multiformis TaxID=3377529 RepID=UPI0037DDBD86
MKKDLKKIDIKAFDSKIFSLWDDQWFLLSAGDYDKGDFNTMTVAWGSLGIMWSVPFAQVVVRPTRHTYHFMNKYNDFTLCAFPEKYQEDLSYLGSHSGRDEDKIAKTLLTPCASDSVKAPSFEEAELIIECQKMYEQDMDPNLFLENFIHTKYKENDYHRIYFGKILNLFQAENR